MTDNTKESFQDNDRESALLTYIKEEISRHLLRTSNAEKTGEKSFLWGNAMHIASNCSI